MANLIINNSVLEVDLVIFDKDGTLIDLHTYWVAMIRMRAEAVGKALDLPYKYTMGLMESMGIDVEKMKIKPEGPVGLKKREVVQQAGVAYLVEHGFEDHTDLFTQAFTLVDEQSIEYLDVLVQSLKGAESLLRALKDANCKIAIATTDRTNRSILTMDKLNLSNLIDATFGVDKISKPKPAPEIIEKICKETNVSVKRSIMVGDTISDVKTGLNAGCLASIGVASGVTTVEQLGTVTSYVVEDLSEIVVEDK